MQRDIFDSTLIINHGLKILDPNSITLRVYFIYLVLCGVIIFYCLYFNYYSSPCGSGVPR